MDIGYQKFGDALSIMLIMLTLHCFRRSAMLYPALGYEML